MTTNPDVPTPETMVKQAIILRTEEQPTYDELVGVDLPTEDLAELYIRMQEYQRAAKRVLDVLASELGDALTELGTGVQVGDDWVMFKPRRSSRFMGDSEGFWEYMLANPELLPKAFNPNTLRKTGIPESVLDTFFDIEESAQPFVSTVPIHVLENAKRQRGNKK